MKQFDGCAKALAPVTYGFLRPQGGNQRQRPCHPVSESRFFKRGLLLLSALSAQAILGYAGFRFHANEAGVLLLAEAAGSGQNDPGAPGFALRSLGFLGDGFEFLLRGGIK